MDRGQWPLTVKYRLDGWRLGLITLIALWALYFLVYITAAYAGPTTSPVPGGVINCELLAYDPPSDTLTLRCPSTHVYAPLRVTLTLTGSPGEDRESVDAVGHPQVKFLAADAQYQVRLPYAAADRRRLWLAWRHFTTLSRILLYETCPR